jgi:MYXO-CTERM domain-containing protein
MQDDLATLFAGLHGSSFRLTRMRSDLAHASLVDDLQLQAASDQSELTNTRRPSSTTGTPNCSSYNYCNGLSDSVEANNDAKPFSCTTASSSKTRGGETPITFAALLGLTASVLMRSKRRRR